MTASLGDHAGALSSLLAERGVAGDLAERLGLYGALLLERNAVVNLTGAREPGAVAEHMLDSLSVAPYVRENVVDVGSGGGFPAIPLALATRVPVVLVEATAKKARFLEDALRMLGIDGRVVVERAERAAHVPDLRGRFRTVTARAVGGVTTVLELTLPFLARGGTAVLQRGTLSAVERNAAHDAALVLGGAVVDEIVLPDAAGMATERRLLIVEQRSLSGPRFPRRTGIPVKKPLCMPGPDGDGDAGR